MLQVARLAPRLLGEASDLVRDFVLGQLDPRGGFRDRSGEPDLYYSVFGIESLMALQVEPPGEELARWVDGLGKNGTGLDLVHLTCLARASADLHPRGVPAPLREGVRAGLESFRSEDGGYGNEPGRTHGTVYGAFLACGAYQDVGESLPEPERVLGFLERMTAASGGFANEPGLASGSTPATAGAVALLRQLDRAPPGGTAEWLAARCLPQGGFVATPATPLPDLLSTATALHALAGLQYPLDEIREPCLDFVDTLWTNRGSFYATWADQELDCEYTYYGLLALGHLSL